MAKYSLGKPTYNSDEPSDSIFQSAAQNSLIYDISQFSHIQTNQIVSSIYMQLGKALYGVKPKFSNNKRSHIELAFLSKEGCDVWAEKEITIIGKNLTPTRSHNGKKSFLSITLSGVPLCDQMEMSDKIYETFEKYGKIATIKPKLWEGTTLCSDNWLLTFDVTGHKDVSSLTNNLPRLISINGDRVYVTWKEAPRFCTFCRKSGHKRPECLDLKNAKENKRI
jgi:hypothetical protein